MNQAAKSTHGRYFASFSSAGRYRILLSTSRYGLAARRFSVSSVHTAGSMMNCAKKEIPRSCCVFEDQFSSKQMMPAATAATLSAAALLTLYFSGSDPLYKSSCEDAATNSIFETEDEDVSYSSSDPMILPTGDHASSEVMVHSVPARRPSGASSSCGKSSEYSKSVRALETSMKAATETLATSTGGAFVGLAPTKTERVMQIVDDASLVTTRKMYFYRHAFIDEKKANKLVLLSGTQSQELSNDIAHYLDIPISAMDLGKFADGETSVQAKVSVRGKHIYLVNSSTSSDAIMEILLITSMLRRASAKSITAVIPYYGYSRQDDKKRLREPIAAADVARMLEEVGVDRVMCLDLHSDTMRGFFSNRVPVEHLMPAPVAAAYFHEELMAMIPEDAPIDYYPAVTIVASHEGQVKRAEQFRNVLRRLSGADIELAVLSKQKLQPGEATYTARLVGNANGRKCILVDDIVNTGTTLISNIETLKQEGASSIYAWATHGVFGPENNDTPERLDAMPDLEFLLISNSINSNRTLPLKIRQLNVAPLLAEAIARSLHNESISSILSLEPEETVERYDG